MRAILTGYHSAPARRNTLSSIPLLSQHIATTLLARKVSRCATVRATPGSVICDTVSTNTRQALPTCRRNSTATATATATATSAANPKSFLLIPPRVWRSSMYAQGVGAALISIVGYGAWTLFNGHSDSVAGIRYFTSPSTTGGLRGVGGKDDANVPSLIGQKNTQNVRQVLVISADELRTGTWVGDGPISKQTDGRVLEMLNSQQATDKLRRHEESYFVNRGRGVVRYDVVQVGSNDPIEDDHAEKIVEVPTNPSQKEEGSTADWMFWGVFDGHSGWTTSAKLKQTLIRHVATEINDTYINASRGQKDAPSAALIDLAMQKGFVKLDNEIVHEAVEKSLAANSQNKAAELLAPALSGSCALLGYYDTATETLRVACTGDSRAVLGQRAASGKWVATPLSVDQTGANPDEANRLRREHPGEEAKVVRNGRVLGGLEPTRAFGDAIYKWTRSVHEKLRSSFFVRSVNPDLKTPPYVTAEPVVTRTQVEPREGDFLVMATDGLWEMLTNEEVVGLVGKWIETQRANGMGISPSSQSSTSTSTVPGSSGSFGGGSLGSSAMSWIWPRDSAADEDLPVELPSENLGKAEDGSKTPIRPVQWKAKASDRFVVKDANVATHLVRNALGGKNEEQVCALLTLPAPYSRRYRDDLTVTVVFFGNQPVPATGQQIEVNEDATAPVKSKL